MPAMPPRSRSSSSAKKLSSPRGGDKDDEEVSDIDDERVEKLIIVTPSPKKRGEVRSHHGGGTQRAIAVAQRSHAVAGGGGKHGGKLSEELLAIINEGLYIYEQDLHSRDHSSYSTVSVEPAPAADSRAANSMPWIDRAFFAFLNLFAEEAAATAGAVSSGTGPGQISSKSIAIVNSLKPARYHQRLYPRKPGEQGTDVGWIIGSCLFLASFCFSFFPSLLFLFFFWRSTDSRVQDRRECRRRPHRPSRR